MYYNDATIFIYEPFGINKKVTGVCTMNAGLRHPTRNVYVRTLP